MIPLKLRLKNFLSYGEPTQELDFTTFSIACLSGKNGHGKSALLDSIIWAIWGQARKTDTSSRSNEEFVKLGSYEMSVEFEFLLEENHYRVIRTFFKGKSRPHLLSFQVFDENAGEFHTLDKPSITETQTQINETLKIDFETFINSSFILQGRANEFTSKKPSERKEILSKILNLERFAVLEKLAKEDKKKAQQEIDFLQRKVSELESQIAKKESFQAELLLENEKLAQLDKILKSLNSEIRQTEKNQESFETIKKQQKSLLEHLQTVKNERKNLLLRLQNLEQKLNENLKILSHKTEIEANFSRFGTFQKREKELAETFAKISFLEKELAETKQKILNEKAKIENKKIGLETEKSSLEKQLQNLQELVSKRLKIKEGFEKLAELEAKIKLWQQKKDSQQKLLLKKQEIFSTIENQKKELDAEIGNLENQKQKNTEKLAEQEFLKQKLVELNQDLQKKQQFEKNFQEVKEKGQTLKERSQKFLPEEIERLESEIFDFEEKNKLFHTGKNACPVCQSELSHEKTKQVENHYSAEIGLRKTRAQNLKNELESVKNELLKAKSTFTELEKTLKNFVNLETKIGETQAKLEELEKVKIELSELETKILEKKKIVLNKKFAEEERKNYALLSEEITKIAYDEETHKKIITDFQALEHFKIEFSKLNEALLLQEKISAELPKLSQKILELEQVLEQRDFAKEEIVSYKKLETEKKEFFYDAEEHKKIKNELENLKNASANFENLKNAVKREAELEEERTKTQTELVSKNLQSEKFEKDFEEVNKVFKNSEDFSERLKEAKQTFEVSSKEKSQKLTELGGLKEKLKQIEIAEQEFAGIEKQKKFFSEEVMISDEVAKMFGKNGIPALIIENEVVEIEQEANEILSRLTNGTTTLAFKSQVENAKGEFKETLEILISDTSGTRNYELFSGGEAFRIDFALRVALSKVLAQRSGTKLQTLVIDEGFGTQDEEGIENLIEAINEVKFDFEKILIVTHLDRLKDVFPVRIEVEKFADRGSVFKILSE
ncbi:AAA family ATPase [bacterium]|nr:AAA family ATPase [bacterium]